MKFARSLIWMAALPFALEAQSPGSWNNLKDLAPGREIQLRLTDGRRIRGPLESVTDDAVVVSAAKAPETIARPSIQRAMVKGKGHRGRNALIGLGIGAGVGLAIGAKEDSKSNQFGPRRGKDVLTPLGAIIGAGVGAVIPSGGFHEIYRAP